MCPGLGKLQFGEAETVSSRDLDAPCQRPSLLLRHPEADVQDVMQSANVRLVDRLRYLGRVLRVPTWLMLRVDVLASPMYKQVGVDCRIRRPFGSPQNFVCQFSEEQRHTSLVELTS